MTHANVAPTVAQIAQNHVVALEATASIGEAARTMAKRKIGSVAVREDGHRWHPRCIPDRAWRAPQEFRAAPDRNGTAARTWPVSTRTGRVPSSSNTTSSTRTGGR